MGHGKKYLVVILILSVIAPTAFAQYVATVLHPPAYEWSVSLAATGGSQYGRVLSWTNDDRFAAKWSYTSNSFESMHQSGWEQSRIFGATNGQQAGWAVPNGQPYEFATIWNGSAASAVNLHPESWRSTVAYATDGVQQVGEGINLQTGTHAILWNGSALDFVSLYHPGIQQSRAFGVGGGIQVGIGWGNFTNSSPHALAWEGTAASITDLHPAGYVQSEARATDGTQIVGDVTVGGGVGHAALWNGLTGSFVDLNPDGWRSSHLFAVANGVQVGNGRNPTYDTSAATVWFGSAGSALDLHQYLNGEYDASIAYGIDASTGDIVGQAWNAGDDTRKAVVWQAVPEPASMAALGIGVLALIRRRKKTTRGNRS